MASKQGQLIAVTDDQEGASPRIVTRDDPFPMYDADVNSQMVNEHLIQETAVSDLLRATASIDEYSIDVTDGTKFSADDRIILVEGAKRETG